MATPARTRLLADGHALYLREDRILARVAAGLRGEVGDEAPSAPDELAEYIRQQGITIICRHDSCTLDTNTGFNQPLLINA